MASKPQCALIIYECLLEARPKIVDLPLEAAVNPTGCLGHRTLQVKVGLDVVPVVRLRTAAGDDRIVVVGKNVGLGAIAVVEAYLREADSIG
jgi:hypothetical protein